MGGRGTWPGFPEQVSGCEPSDRGDVERRWIAAPFRFAALAGRCGEPVNYRRRRDLCSAGDWNRAPSDSLRGGGIGRIGLFFVGFLPSSASDPQLDRALYGEEEYFSLHLLFWGGLKRAGLTARRTNCARRTRLWKTTGKGWGERAEGRPWIRTGSVGSRRWRVGRGGWRGGGGRSGCKGGRRGRRRRGVPDCRRARRWRCGSRGGWSRRRRWPR